MAFCDEISSVHKEEFNCASVHLGSGVHFKCALDFLVYKMKSAWSFSVV